MRLNLNSLKLKNSLIIIGVMLPLLVCFLAYDLYRQSNAMRKALTDRGIIVAQTGAAAAGKVLSDAIRYGVLTEEQVFDTDYRLIPNTDPPKYHTAYDQYTDQNLRGIQDSYLKDNIIIYAVALDINGYVPTHNTVSTAQTGLGYNPSRTKRIFNDPVGIAAVQNLEPYLFQEYKRDTGEIMWDISSPIYVNGRHWGGFRVGFSIEETNKRIAAIRNEIIGGGLVLIVALIILILYISQLITDPVKRLEQEAMRVARGDLSAISLEAESSDEMGRLIRSFSIMVDKLRQLTEKIRGSADQVVVYITKLQGSIQNAAETASLTAIKMNNLSETMKKVEAGAGVVIESSQSAVVNFANAEKASEKLAKKMQTSSKVIIRARESVGDLESYVQKVGEIIQYTALIADQANNLAIKAVRETSGREGSSFSALASEIQSRAQEAAAAIKGVSDLFEKAQQHARQASTALEKDLQDILEGFHTANEATSLLKPIVTDIQKLAQTVKEVLVYTQQVSEGICGVNASAEEQARLAEGFVEAAEVLEEVVGELQETLLSIRI